MQSAYVKKAQAQMEMQKPEDALETMKTIQRLLNPSISEFIDVIEQEIQEYSIVDQNDE